MAFLLNSVAECHQTRFDFDLKQCFTYIEQVQRLWRCYAVKSSLHMQHE
jgi:hypothetical protein